MTSCDGPIVSYSDIAQLIGEAMALQLSKAHGGRSLYIPSPQRLKPTASVVVLVGVEAAAKLGQRYNGASIVVPIGPGKRARVWELREMNWSIPRIAAEMRCHERTVYNILAGPRPRALAAPAPAELPPLLAYIAKR